MRRADNRKAALRSKIGGLVLVLVLLLLLGTVGVRVVQAGRLRSDGAGAPEQTIPAVDELEPVFPGAEEQPVPEPPAEEDAEPESQIEEETEPEDPGSTEETALIESVPATSESRESASGGKEIRYDKQTYELVSDIVTTYKQQPSDVIERTRNLLDQLTGLDADLGTLWDHIMGSWYYVDNQMEIHPGVLPDGLPEDDSLCIVVLGFQLLPNGNMGEELIGRCEAALASAEKYPNAYLALTGGGTAVNNRAATEARAMEAWFLKRGVAPERIIVEENSMTTDENARYTTRILTERYPSVKSLAIVTSSYHVPLGSLMFTEAAILYGYEHGERPFSVLSNAAYETTSLEDFQSPRSQAPYVWLLAAPTY